MFDFLVGNDTLSAIFAFIIVLIPAVIVHELGHFLAARSIGISVLEFGIGFPPRVGRLFMWKETEFTFNLIPLGGFVLPFGEDMVQTDKDDKRHQEAALTDVNAGHIEQQDDPNQSNFYSQRKILAQRGVMNPKSVYEAKPLPRIFFMSAGALANFIFALIIFVLIGLVGLPQEVGVRLGLINVAPNSVMADAGFVTGDWITEWNGEYLQSQFDFIERLQASEGETVTLTLRRLQENDDYAGATMELTVTPELIAAWDSVGSYVRIASVEGDSPADEAGLQPDDLIYQFNDISLLESFDPGTTLQQLTNDAAGTPVTLTMLRDGETVTATLIPRVEVGPGQGRMGVGIRAEYATPDESILFLQRAQVDYVPSGVADSINYGVDSTIEVFDQIAQFPSRLVQGLTTPEERRVISVVGVSQAGGVILRDSIENQTISIFLRYMALINIALGFTNLLPIPALDGGRIVFAVIELIRGKPVPPEREGYVHMVGLIFLLSLGVLLMINDLLNPVSDLLQ